MSELVGTLKDKLLAQRAPMVRVANLSVRYNDMRAYLLNVDIIR